MVLRYRCQLKRYQLNTLPRDASKNLTCLCGFAAFEVAHKVKMIALLTQVQGSPFLQFRALVLLGHAASLEKAR